MPTTDFFEGGIDILKLHSDMLGCIFNKTVEKGDLSSCKQINKFVYLTKKWLYLDVMKIILKIFFISFLDNLKDMIM